MKYRVIVGFDGAGLAIFANRQKQMTQKGTAIESFEMMEPQAFAGAVVNDPECQMHRALRIANASRIDCPDDVPFLISRNTMFQIFLHV